MLRWESSFLVGDGACPKSPGKGLVCRNSCKGERGCAFQKSPETLHKFSVGGERWVGPRRLFARRSEMRGELSLLTAAAGIAYVFGVSRPKACVCFDRPPSRQLDWLCPLPCGYKKKINEIIYALLQDRDEPSAQVATSPRHASAAVRLARQVGV